MEFFRTFWRLFTGQRSNWPTTYADWRLHEPVWNKILSQRQGFNTPYYQEWLDARNKLYEEVAHTPIKE